MKTDISYVTRNFDVLVEAAQALSDFVEERIEPQSVVTDCQHDLLSFVLEVLEFCDSKEDFIQAVMTKQRQLSV